MSNRQPEIVVTEKTIDPATKLFIDGDDKNVAVTVIYTVDGSTFTYDKDGTKEISADDMFTLFVKGVVAIKNDTYYKPTSCTKNGNIVFPFA